MALPEKQMGTFTPSELTFLAEDSVVTIIPRQNVSSIELIGGEMSSLRTMRRVEVPIWIAMILKKQSRCNIIMPEWLNEKRLLEAYDSEARDMHRFSSDLPWNWIEIGELILSSAADDLDCAPHVVRNLLRDLREIRQSKVREGLRALDAVYVQLDNVGAMELNEIRPLVTMTMNELRAFKKVDDQDDDLEGPTDIYGESDIDDEIPEGSQMESFPTGNESYQSIRSARPAQSYSDDDEGDNSDGLEMDQSYVNAMRSEK
ncbi:uncharacterized protein V1516DRAFT_677668 [Lipomyces oligophaga]|uniref:uncharacterized protein n=1 Tax=Lipomyces oligophaga TaxID=45792 RepID=UPI0034CDAFDA